MIDFSENEKRLEKIAKSISNISYNDLETFYTGLLKDNLNHASSSHIASLRFDEDGRPFTRFGKGLSILSVEIEHMLHRADQYRYLLRGHQHTVTVTTYPGFAHKIDQVYITIALDQPDYQVLALGRKFNIDPEKHPELFLRDDELSYAYLLGENPIVGLPSYYKKLRTVVEFIMTACNLVETRNAESIATRKENERGVYYQGAYYFK